MSTREQALAKLEALAADIEKVPSLINTVLDEERYCANDWRIITTLLRAVFELTNQYSGFKCVLLGA